jgi:hypothetical protein
MLVCRVTFKRTTGFWIFKKEETFFYRIIAAAAHSVGDGYMPGDFVATVYAESRNAPELKVKRCASWWMGATEMDAVNGLVGLIAEQTKSTVVNTIQL